MFLKEIAVVTVYGMKLVSGKRYAVLRHMSTAAHTSLLVSSMLDKYFDNYLYGLVSSVSGTCNYTAIITYIFPVSLFSSFKGPICA